MSTDDARIESPTVLDAHQHIDVRYVSAGADQNYESLRKDLDLRIELMDRENIAQTVLMPSYDYDKRLGLESTQRSIDALLEYQSWAPDRIRWLGLTVEPQFYDAAVTQLRDALSTGRFRIVSWHNRYQGASVDHSIMFEFVKAAAEFGAVVCLHANHVDHEEGWRVANIVRAFPDTRFLITDVLSGSFAQMSDVLNQVNNIWIDTAGASTFVHAGRASIERQLGWDRVVFGSDVYNSQRGGSPQLVRQWLAACDLDASTLAKVCGQNLVALMDEA